MSKREQILAQVGVLLNGVGKPGGVPDAKRTRREGLTPDDFPAIDYFPDTDRVSSTHGQSEGPMPGARPKLVVKRALDVWVECFALGTDSVSADEALDAMTTWVVQALAGATADWTGIAISAAEVQTEFDFFVLDKPAAMARVTIRVHYKAQVGDPSAG